MADGSGCGAAWSGVDRHAPRAGLSDASDHHDRAVSRRWRDRHAGPLPRRTDAAHSGPAHHHREHRRGPPPALRWARPAVAMGLGPARRPPADGYTLSIGTSTTHMLTGGLYTLSYDLLKDLEPII